MGFLTSKDVNENYELHLAFMNATSSTPTQYVITYNGSGDATAGATSLALQIATVDGSAAGAGNTMLLQHGAYLRFPAKLDTYAVKGAVTAGKRTMLVDDGSALPSPLLAVGMVFRVGTATQDYTVTEVSSNATDQTVGFYPPCVGGFADNAVITVYFDVKVAIPDGTGQTDVIAINGSTTTDVPVEEITYGITDTDDTLVTYETFQLLGITQASFSPSVETVDTKDMKSGFGKSTVTVGVDRTVAIQGQKVGGDRCFTEIILSYLMQDANLRTKRLYGIYREPNGTYARGKCAVSDSGGDAAINNVKTYSLGIRFEGNSFEFYDGYSKLMTNG